MVNNENKVKEIKGFCCQHCADECNLPRKQPDSGSQSWMCNRCGHYGVGSYVEFRVGDWLVLQAVKYLNK